MFHTPNPPYQSIADHAHSTDKKGPQLFYYSTNRYVLPQEQLQDTS